MKLPGIKGRLPEKKLPAGINSDHKNCVCCELPLERGVPTVCQCPNH